MATDRAGQTIATGDLYALVGKVRKIETNDVVLVSGSRGTSAVRCAPGNLVRLDEIPYAFHMPGLLVNSFANPVTSVILHLSDGNAGLNSNTYRIPIPRNCRAVDVAVRATSLDEEPQSDWELELYKGSTKVGTFAFTFAVNPNFAITTGVWTSEEGQSLDFAAGDEMHMRASGSGQNAAAVYVCHGWRTR